MTEPHLPLRTTVLTQDRLVILAAFLLATSGYLLAEKITIGEGFGWDGVTYGELARDFHREAYVKSIDAYRVQRIAPPFLVHYGLRLFGLSLTNANIIHGFGTLNIICITLLAWCWNRIARELKISSRGVWLGFCGLFLNYAVAKNGTYYPVLTDIPAMAIGGAMLVCYLESRRIPLLILAGIGAFTWPTLLGQGVLLALFPREPGRSEYLTKATWHLNSVVAGLAAYYLVMLDIGILMRIPATVWSGVTPMRSVSWLSVALAAIFLFQVVSHLLDWNWQYDIRKCFQFSFWRNAILVLGFAIAIKVIQATWATKPSILAPQTYVLLIGLWTIAKPGVFLLAQILYYGPCIILGMFLWKPMTQQIRQTGLGLTLMLLFAISLGMDSESRHLINFVPAFVAFVIKATEPLRWTIPQYAFLAILSFVFSKCWFTINTGPMIGNALAWPDQRFMMAFGPYMSDQMYLWQGAIVLVASVAIYWVCFRPRSTQGNVGVSDDLERSRREAYHA
ncbi:MAG TPA: hypothetical protein VGM98_19660 [Schlesneria sp.]